MKHSIYNQYKAQIIEFAKTLTKDDKPLRNQSLNDELDHISREFSDMVLREQLSEKLSQLYLKWLTDLVIKLHV